MHEKTEAAYHSPTAIPPPSVPLPPPPEPTLFPIRAELDFVLLFAPSLAAVEKEVFAKDDISEKIDKE